MLAWLLGAVGAAALVWGVWWALFADRSRGSLRCSRCWHQIAPGAASPCPECGQPFSGEAELLRTRRRWPAALGCLAVLVAGTLWLRVRLTESGWWVMVPPRALIALVPSLGDSEDGSMARGHLLRLLMSQQLSDENAVRIIELLRDGDAEARPGSQAWRNRYGRWLDSLRGSGFWKGYGSRPGPRRAALSVGPTVSLVTPPPWRQDDPLVVTAEIDDWYPPSTTLEIEFLDAEGLPLPPATLARLRGTRWRCPEGGALGGAFPITLGELPAGVHDGFLRMGWRVTGRGDAIGADGGGELRVPLHLDVRAALPEPIAVRDAFIDERVTEAFRPGMLRHDDPISPRFAFTYRPIETAGEAMRDISFGFVVEACEEGVPRRTLHVWWCGEQFSRAGWEIFHEDIEALRRATESTAWTLRIRGDPVLARRAPCADKPGQPMRYWAGEVTIPLRVEETAAERFTRRWRLQTGPREAPR